MRKVLSRAEWAVLISMLVVALLALTASITLAAMSDSKYGKNTIYIAQIGEMSATATTANVFPGGTATTNLNFNLGKIEANHEVNKVKVSNFKLSGFTIYYGNTSKTFESVTQGTNSTTVKTTAGNWVFALDLASTPTITAGSPLATSLSITAPLGAASGSTGSPAEGYLVSSVTKIECNFQITVEPTEY